MPPARSVSAVDHGHRPAGEHLGGGELGERDGLAGARRAAQQQRAGVRRRAARSRRSRAAPGRARPRARRRRGAPPRAGGRAAARAAGDGPAAASSRRSSGGRRRRRQQLGEIEVLALDRAGDPHPAVRQLLGRDDDRVRAELAAQQRHRLPGVGRREGLEPHGRAPAHTWPSVRIRALAWISFCDSTTVAGRKRSMIERT